MSDEPLYSHIRISSAFAGKTRSNVKAYPASTLDKDASSDSEFDVAGEPPMHDRMLVILCWRRRLSICSLTNCGKGPSDGRPGYRGGRALLLLPALVCRSDRAIISSP